MKLKTLFTALAAAGGVQMAEAASLSPDGRGQVLIYPYYTAQGTYDTLFSVVNPFYAAASRYKAVKVRFREGRNSRPVLDFNIYLSPGTVFTAMVTRDVSGNPVLRTQSTVCTVPQFLASTAMPGWKEIAFTNAAYAGYDRAGSGLERAREGFFEALEMAELVPTFDLGGGKLLGTAMMYANQGEPTGTQDCAAVEQAWATGGAFLTSGGTEATAPGGGLYGMGTLISVAEGTDYSFDPVALDKVYSTTHHTAAGAASPTLADADPQSVALAGGTAYASTWNNGIDAVSAVLMRKVVMNEYIATTPELQAASDIVLTFPTKGFYTVRESDTGQSTRAPFSAEFDDLEPAGGGASGPLLADGSSKGACETIFMSRYTTDGRINSQPGSGIGFIPAFPLDPPYACWAATLFSFDDVLSSANATAITEYKATTFGRFDIDLLSSLTSNEGHKYSGLPVVGFTVHKYVNGNLNGVLSNYGGTLAHKYMTVVE